MRTTFKAKVLNTEFFDTLKAEDGDWVEGFYYMETMCYCNGYEYCECDGYEQHLIYDDDEQNTYPIDINTLCQCIGLTDIKGHYIYIGDILVDKYGNLFTVKKKINGWGLYLNDTNRERTLNYIKKYKIIGNIHDNKEEEEQENE